MLCFFYVSVHMGFCHRSESDIFPFAFYCKKNQAGKFYKRIWVISNFYQFQFFIILDHENKSTIDSFLILPARCRGADVVAAPCTMYLLFICERLFHSGCSGHGCPYPALYIERHIDRFVLFIERFSCFSINWNIEMLENDIFIINKIIILRNNFIIDLIHS